MSNKALPLKNSSIQQNGKDDPPSSPYMTSTHSSTINLQIQDHPVPQDDPLIPLETPGNPQHSETELPNSPTASIPEFADAYIQLYNDSPTPHPDNLEGDEDSHNDQPFTSKFETSNQNIGIPIANNSISSNPLESTYNFKTSETTTSSSPHDTNPENGLRIYRNHPSPASLHQMPSSSNSSNSNQIFHYQNNTRSVDMKRPIRSADTNRYYDQPVAPSRQSRVGNTPGSRVNSSNNGNSHVNGTQHAGTSSLHSSNSSNSSASSASPLPPHTQSSTSPSSNIRHSSSHGNINHFHAHPNLKSNLPNIKGNFDDQNDDYVNDHSFDDFNDLSSSSNEFITSQTKKFERIKMQIVSYRIAAATALVLSISAIICWAFLGINFTMGYRVKEQPVNECKNIPIPNSSIASPPTPASQPISLPLSCIYFDHDLSIFVTLCGVWSITEAILSMVTLYASVAFFKRPLNRITQITHGTFLVLTFSMITWIFIVVSFVMEEENWRFSDQFLAPPQSPLRSETLRFSVMLLILSILLLFTSAVIIYLITELRTFWLSQPRSLCWPFFSASTSSYNQHYNNSILNNHNVSSEFKMKTIKNHSSNSNLESSSFDLQTDEMVGNQTKSQNSDDQAAILLATIVKELSVLSSKVDQIEARSSAPPSRSSDPFAYGKLSPQI